MKRIFILILAASMALSIAACSGGDNTSSDEASEKTSSVAETSGNNSKTDENREPSKEEASKAENSKEKTSKEESSKEESSKEESSKEESSKKENSKSSSKKKDAVVYNNVEVTVGADISKLLKKLGDPDFKETIEPEFEGGEESYSYTYDNMTVYAYKNDGKQYLSDIYINGPGEAKTGAGITSGSSRSDVSKAYGDAGKDNTVTYEIGGNIITFMMQDDSVTDISIGKALVDEEL